MARRYSSFMVRCWALGDGGLRAEIECIPSGEKIAVASLAAALEWMTARVLSPGRGAAAQGPGGTGREEDAPDAGSGNRPALG